MDTYLQCFNLQYCIIGHGAGRAGEPIRKPVGVVAHHGGGQEELDELLEGRRRLRAIRAGPGHGGTHGGRRGQATDQWYKLLGLERFRVVYQPVPCK